MRRARFQFVLAAAAALVLLADVRAADPVTIELSEQATVGTAIVTLGDIAVVSGGDPALRGRIAKLDIAELKVHDANTTLGRRSVEYRILLAGFEAGDVQVAGAERTVVAVARRSVTAEEVTAAARVEVLRKFTTANDSVIVDLAVPVVVKLPDVPANERVSITAKPHGKPGTNGRIQVDMTIAACGETLLSFAVQMEVRSLTRPGLAVTPAGGIVPSMPVATAGAIQPAATVDVIRPRQRVDMQYVSGGLKVTAVGEAQQAGKVGQTILVQNVDSKKTISARVTGPGTVEIDLGGAP